MATPNELYEVLVEIRDEIRKITKHIRPEQMTSDQLEKTLTGIFGIGPDDVGNKL